MVNINLDGLFLVVIVTSNLCPRHVCLMSVTKEIHYIADELNSDGSNKVKISTMKGFI